MKHIHDGITSRENLLPQLRDAMAMLQPSAPEGMRLEIREFREWK